MHRILDNQIKKIFGDETPDIEGIGALLDEVDATYRELEKDSLSKRIQAPEDLSGVLEKNRTMEAFFENTPDVIFHIKKNGEIVSCYGAVKKVFGLTEDYFHGKNIYELTDLFENSRFADRAQVCQLTQETVNFQIDRPETHYAHHFDARIIPLPEGDMLLDLRNITLKKHAEDAIRETHRKLQDIIEFLPDATFVVDSKKKVIAWNRAIEKMTGVSKHEMVRRDDNAYSLPFYGERRPTLVNFIDKPLEEIKELYNHVKVEEDTLVAETFVPKLNNGKGAWIWAKVSPLYGKNRKIIGAIQTIRDISHRVKSEQITKALYKLTSDVYNAEGLDIIFESIHSTLREVIKADNFYVALKENDSLIFPYYRDEMTDLPDHTCVDCNECYNLTCEVLKTGKPLILNHEEILERIDSGHQIFGTIPKVWIAVPLRCSSGVIGAMVTQDYRDPEHFSIEDRELLIAASENIAMAVERKNAEEAMRKSEKKYRKIFENSTEGIFQTDSKGNLISANPAFAEIMGYDSPEDITGKSQINDFYFDDKDRTKAIEEIDKTGGLVNFECRATRKDDSVIWVSVNAKRISGNVNGDNYIEGTFKNITERKLAESARDHQKARFTQLFENSPQAICLLNKEGKIVSVNRQFTSLFGCDEDLDSLRDCFIPDDKLEEAQTLINAVFTGQSISEESQRRTVDGRLIPVSILGYPFNFRGQIAGAFFIFNDISERKEYENQITHQALHDSLTGLPNRALFIERLSRALARKKSDPDYSFAVMLVDLDRFKKINDSLGHMAGDELLVYTGLKLKEFMRPMDTLARLGGDEFCILLENVEKDKDVIDVAEKIRKSIAAPLLVHGNEVVISASIGIVLKVDEYDNTDTILRDADISMYRSKELGKNRYKVFTKRLHDKVVTELKVESELRKALTDNEFETYFQPIYALNNMSLNGFEALVRWNHPQKGLIPPGNFIPVAEETGLISDIGEWVFRDSCSTLSSWRNLFPSAKNINLAVNLSALQFSQPELLDTIESIISATGLPTENLRLEITESAIMDNTKAAVKKLHAIRNLGVKIAVDDFGTGYSSLSQLQSLPVDILKVDRSFVMHMEEDADSKAIVKMVIALAHTLGLDVVAEGVETEGQLRMLHAMNCNFVQGFLFSRPVEAREARSMLHEKE